MPASKVEVEAVFTAIETEPEQPESLPFTDVAADAWYAGAVNWAAAQGIVAGYDTGAFGPADALCWAVGEGLLTGKDGGRLDPAGTATRAEVAVILMRFAEKKL